MSLFDGDWHNEYNSEMTLNVDGAGNVTGSYTTHVPVVSGPFPIRGSVDDDIVTWYVMWTGFGKITSWVGQLAPDKDGNQAIQTLWHLVTNIADADEPTLIYTQVQDGADWFYPGLAPKDKSLKRKVLNPSHPVKTSKK